MQVEDGRGEGGETRSGEAPDRPELVPCRTVPWRAPLGWLRRGWQDFRAAPALSLGAGVVIALVSMGVAALAWHLGRLALLAALLSGFVFVAPLLAAGLYCVSRSLELGRPPRLSASLALARRVVGQAGVFAIVQLVILLLWARAGMVVNVFFPVHTGDLAALAEFLLIGSAVGAVFAALTFASAAFSLPLIADRDVDMITAALSSIRAVLRNKPAALVWAGLIVAFTLLGFATAFLGLVLVMPWLAYATWHGYREVMDAEAWPRLE